MSSSTTSRPSMQQRLSLRRLRTVFGPSSPNLSISSTSSTSPLSASDEINEPSRFSFSQASTHSKPFSAAAIESDRYFVQRKKSMAELEFEEERNSEVLSVLVGLVEPRPFAGFAVGGIEEVLSGRI